MGKLSCRKSANLRIKPTISCRTVENILIVCSKYIRTVTSLTKYVKNISRFCGIQIYETIMPYFKYFFQRLFFTLYNFLYIIYCILLSQFLIINFIEPFYYYYFFFSYDSNHLLSTPPDKRYDIYLLCNNQHLYLF